ncbi:MAG: curved DNA-binding protein CbpA, partial [Bacteriovoracaceae bacterium]
MEFKDKNYYEILEVSSTSTPEDVHQGYLRAKNAYSQDSLALYSLMSKEECENILQLIDEAYTIISDPHKRRQYDEARGINQDLSDSFRQQSRLASAGFTKDGADHKINQTEESAKPQSMTKIVAQKKFQLDYKVSEEFEKEIEQATEFSGEFLRRVREYKGVDINRMSEMTKVSKTYIKNIEDEDTTRLPAIVYVRGFVYQYAKCLKLNPDLVATSYTY